MTKNSLINGAKLAAVTAVVALAVTAGANLSAAPADKVTLCHAAGQAGTTKFVELTISWNAAYGQAGHFNEDGTTRAGHELDTLGPCEKKEEDGK